ncbi:MAG: hypothetical protein PF445_10950 [Melioribacteraceae bacterium]|nr:hypothetical protein [Melioribacteraceae bacterium]
MNIGFNNDTQVDADLFTVVRSRVPNKEATFNFEYFKIKSRPIKRRLNMLPVDQSLFWRFANSRLQKYRGTKVNNLYLFLKEVEFRYNNQSNLYNQLIKKIANF